MTAAVGLNTSVGPYAVAVVAAAVAGEFCLSCRIIDLIRETS